MRRTVLACLALVGATTAFAANPYSLDRSGVLWTATATPQGLVLTGTREGTEVVQSVVPFPLSMPGTSDTDIQVAADDLTGKVVVVWERDWPAQASEIMIAVWHAGDWERVDRLSGDLLANPRNPAIQLTQYSATAPASDAPDATGADTVVEDSFIHVAWWEGVDQAHGSYALVRLTADPSDSEAVTEFNLDTMTLLGFGCATTMPASVLEHPVFASQGGHDRALLLFGSQGRCIFQLLQVSFTVDRTPPILQRRRSVPIFGVVEAYPMTRDFSMEGTRVVLGANLSPVAYRVTDQGVQYVTYSNNAWSPVRTLAVSSALTMDQAIPLVENLAR